MTIKEKANKYADSISIGPTARRYLAYKAYLAGAKENGNQLHDLRKDPNDLPKDNDEKLCFYEKGKVVARYDSEFGCWETYFNNLETVIPLSVIIAWCETPTFDKE